MKKTILSIFIILTAFILPLFSAQAQNGWLPPEETPVPTQAPWNYSPIHASPVAPSQPAVVDPQRPLLYITDYKVDGGGKNVSPWGSFTLNFIIGNRGESHARNLVMTFSSQDFDSLDGGVSTLYEVDAQSTESAGVAHRFRVNDMSTWKYSGTITATTSYMDPAGTTFSDTFIFTILIDQKPASALVSPTPSVINRPQMVVNGFASTIDPLQPGSTFKLTLDVSNVGNAEARNVSLVFGGGAISGGSGSGSGGVEVTQDPGGVSGSGADLSNFLPLGKSNVYVIGNVPAGGSARPEQEFVVNVTANPGAYPLKLSFVYTDAKGKRLVDDQVITLMILSLPNLEVSLYRSVDGQLISGQLVTLPIQITNLSRKSVVLGKIAVSTDAGELTNNTALVGTVDAGGYYTLDANFTPSKEGDVELKFAINYIDDFNQPRVFNTSLKLQVSPAPPAPTQTPLLDKNGNPVLDKDGNPVMVDPNAPAGSQPVQEPSTGFWARVWQSIKGFFGFGSSQEVNPPASNPGSPEGGDGGGINMPADGGRDSAVPEFGG